MSTDTRHCTRSVNRDQRLSCVEPATIRHNPPQSTTAVTLPSRQLNYGTETKKSTSSDDVAFDGKALALRVMNLLTDQQVLCSLKKVFFPVELSGKRFLFAFTKDSCGNITRYNEIMQTCKKVNIPVITATVIRHRSSTIILAHGGNR